jgi:hypothetical protein
LQDIQLSKIDPGEYRPAESSVIAGRFPRTPSLTHSRGPQKPRAVRSRLHRSGGISPRGIFGDRGALPPDPLAHSLAGTPKAPRRSFASPSTPTAMVCQSTFAFALRRTSRNLLSIDANREGWPATRSPLTRKLRRAKVGEYRARTGDLLVANQALSQLS